MLVSQFVFTGRDEPKHGRPGRIDPERFLAVTPAPPATRREREKKILAPQNFASFL